MIKPAVKKKGLFQRFFKQTKGHAAIMFAGIALPLLSMVGLAVDGSRGYMAKNELQAALDAGLLAVASTKDSAVDLENRLETFTRRNFSNRAASEPIVTMENPDSQTRIANATTTVNNLFMGLIGRPQTFISVSSTLASEANGLMIALVIDNSGTLWDSYKINTVKESVHLFVDEIFNVQNSGTAPLNAPNSTYVSIVPFAGSVNVGAEANKGTVLDLTQDHSSYTDHIVFPSDPNTPYNVNMQYGNEGRNWKGCVLERTGFSSVSGLTHKRKALVDTTADQDGYWRAFEARHYPYNYYAPPHWSGTINYNIQYTDQLATQRASPNRTCPQAIVPLTNQYDTLHSEINKMSAWNYGGTIIDMGFAWGQRVLSPAPPFSESNTPLESGGPIMAEDPSMKKVIILLAHSTNTLKFNEDTAYGRTWNEQFTGTLGFSGYTANATITRAIEDRTEEICEDIKADGTIIYTISFSHYVGFNGVEVLKGCASNDQTHYFHAPTTPILPTVFKAIAEDLTRNSSGKIRNK